MALRNLLKSMRLRMNLINDDCLKAMANLPDNLVDTVVTDPPYGLNFMGKEWDRLGDKSANFNNLDKPHSSQSNFPMRKSRGRPISETDGRKQREWHYLWAKEVLRVAKPGAFLLCFGGTRTYHRIACAIEDAGWEIRDCIMWVYGSGFPKSLNIGKAVDKLQGNEREIVGKKQNTYDGSIRNPENHKSPAELSNIGKWGLTQTPHGMNETKGTSEWEGYGTALKPAYEPIIVAMKPIDGTFVNNALKHGVAGLNIDDCRVGKKEGDRIEYGVNGIKRKTGNVFGKQYGEIKFDGTQGRFPANLIHDGSDEVVELFPNTKAGVAVRHNSGGNTFGGENKKPPMDDIGYADNGSASRFFYCAKASKAERNRGCEDLETSEKFVAGNYSQSPTCKDCNLTLNGTNDHSECSGEVYYKEMESKQTKNNHPTVKPLKLMEYLCKLTRTPSGGVVLDPFMGSGTTGLACINTGRDFIGIEKEKDYFQIAQRRINDIQNNRSKADKLWQEQEHFQKDKS